VFTVSGPVTKETADMELRSRFVELIDAGSTRFLLDLREVPYMDSAAIGETVACAKRAREKDGVVKIVLQPGGKPDQLFQLTALDRVFQIFSDQATGIASFE
jgi:anti-anti-sigma factor